MMKLNDLVLRSACASKLAYINPNNLSRLKQYEKQLSAGKQLFINNKNSGVQCSVWHTGCKSFLVSFKGSSTVSDIKNTLDFKPVDFSFCNHSMRIHKGVLDMFSSVELELGKYIMSNSLGKCYVTFCGHSLGGGIAALAAAYYSNLTNKNMKVTCHTFGTPPIGDYMFGEWYKKGVIESINVACVNDIVPMLPFIGLVSHDEVMYFDAESQSSCTCNNINLIKNHDLDTYIDKILIELSKNKHE